ncbi:eukaryotic translation initiation factor 2 subunit 2-like [Mizuhopecten yessoensis]|uniref:Eukaryotic translation initiation factor 2 subunit 2 n=1 Tax=Mizuhopecten yessoensis TaxID=6573 RepID=A0A210QF30_MIZYE|nr:eukaryotic translation initiation factor 2 subunit 2-like [Mizuhopecten yessoensis]OWF47356.1 Eukaryotic translation initiation factor 2 subunit 2 [Mizuhopecten yessoensis]
MAEDESFMLDLKKKKKKKKVPFDMDSAETTDGPASQTDATDELNEEQEKPEKSEKIDDDMSFDFTNTKKKKKKKKAFDMDDVGEALPESTENTETPAYQDGQDAVTTDDLTGDFNLDLPQRKKKKKKKNVDFEAIEDPDEADDDDTIDARDDRVSGNVPEGKSWLGSDRDYTYDELLSRVFDIIREKNPDMVAGEKKIFKMRPPQVLKVGTRKTSFANFADICRFLHRQPKHVLAFLLAELGTSGSVDGNNQLVIRGKYNQKQIENVLRRYIKEYVTCHTCRSPDTLLQKDTRLFFLQCETCGSRCSVASIKSGFQAVTGKRAAIRAKTA